MTSILPMPDPTARRRTRMMAWCCALLMLAMPLLAPVVVRADTPAAETTEARLRRIEGELRALQRRVFPDGAGKIFSPQITPGDPATPPPEPSGNAAALGDLLARMDAVESQVKALTASSEDNQNRLAALDQRLAAIETAQAAAAQAAAAASPPPAAVPDTPPPAPVAPAKAKPKPGVKPAPAEATSPTPSSPQAADRAAAVAAIERPSSDDKGEDAYNYGYRLWEAKFLPEAQAVLLDFVQRYPTHRRISYARNLLGRAYLDDNRIRSAAQWFLQNYLTDKTGDRAPDSLLFLAIAMIRDKEVKRACNALSEFRQTYPAEAAGRLKGQFDATTKTVTCHS